MAIGAVSSRQVLQNIQAPEASTILRSGESMGSTAEALKDPNSKTYYHSVHGAKFIMPDGLELVFFGGQLTTNDPAIIQQLDAVANKTASLIFTKRENLAAVGQQAAQAAADAADTAGKATA
jgi:hypothetical protein